MRILAHPAKGRSPRPQRPPRWGGNIHPCGPSGPPATCGPPLNTGNALRYVDKYYGKGKNNAHYGIDDDNDCTNFVSQVLWAGGMRLRRAYEAGPDSWWFWRFPNGLRKGSEEHTESWVRFDSLRDQLLHLGLGRRIPISGLRAGDLIFYDWGGGNGHAVTVRRVTRNNAWLCYHSNNDCRWRRPRSPKDEESFEGVMNYEKDDNAHRVGVRIVATAANIHSKHQGH